MQTYLIRNIERQIKADLAKKMVFIAGPRQTGKTTLALHCNNISSVKSANRYLNWDITAHRQAIIEERFPAGPGPLILDEIHKYSRWRQLLKGLYDLRKEELQILVTGSARLDYYRRGGDSLQGRYHFFRLLPFTLDEIGGESKSALDSLFHYSGFPEPFLSASEKEARRWSREYRSRVIQSDLADLERVMDTALVERLAFRMPELVGSPLSLNGLREDLQVSHQTVARWVQLLENIYMIFRIYPFGASNIRAVKKEAKHYHFDLMQVLEPGARFENLFACHLLAWCWYEQDAEGRDIELKYFRDTDGREVDFIICEKHKPLYAVECKLKDSRASLPLRYFKAKFPEVKAVQVIKEFDDDVTTKENIRICAAHRFLQKRPAF